MHIVCMKTPYVARGTKKGNPLHQLTQEIHTGMLYMVLHYTFYCPKDFPQYRIMFVVAVFWAKEQHFRASSHIFVHVIIHRYAISDYHSSNYITTQIRKSCHGKGCPGYYY